MFEEGNKAACSTSTDNAENELEPLRRNSWFAVEIKQDVKVNVRETDIKTSCFYSAVWIL